MTEVLGRGGFGVVLKAFDPALGRFVAIKVLASQLAASAAARSRFAREAKAAAAVVHENVVAIHAVDSWNGLPYLVMPCIAGRSLQERVDRDGPLAVKEVLRVGMQAALGLAAAHDQGLVHRDIKPSNILLENGVERVKLSDFGLARAVDDASQTQSGVVAGTPQYMSPEQARGEAVDHRSDLFSLGGVLYFMCTGHPPFRADSTPAVLRRVCDDRPRPLREVNPDVPDWLAEVVDRLLAKERGGRFSSAAEVAEVMKHHLAELQRTGTSAPLRPIPPQGDTPEASGTKDRRRCFADIGRGLRPGRDRGAEPDTRLAAALRRPRTAGREPGGGGEVAEPWPLRSPRTKTRVPRLSARAIRPRRTWGSPTSIAWKSCTPSWSRSSGRIASACRSRRTTTCSNMSRPLKEGSALKIALEEGKSYRMKAGSLKAKVEHARAGKARAEPRGPRDGPGLQVGPKPQGPCVPRQHPGGRRRGG